MVGLHHLAYTLEDVVSRHLDVAVELRVAERAAQVASSKAHKHRRTSRVAALALQRVEYVVYPIHLLRRQRCCPRSPAPWPCSTAAPGPRTSGRCSRPSD